MAEARHGVRLGERAKGDRTILVPLEGEDAGELTLVDKLVVDLVRDQPHVVFAAELGDRHQLVACQHRAGRVVRVGDHHRTRARRNRGAQFVDRRMEGMLGAEGDVRDLDARGAQHLRVRRVERLGHDQSVARSDDGHQHAEQCSLGAGEEVDVLGTDLAAGLLGRVGTDRRDHVAFATRVRVAGATTGDRRLDLGQDCSGWGRVGLANREHDDVLARGSSLGSNGVHFPGRVRLVGEAEGECGVARCRGHARDDTGGSGISALAVIRNRIGETLADNGLL